MEVQAINLKLVESLLQIINALAPAEKNWIRSRLLQKTPTSPPKYSAIDILTASPGPQLFQTPEEVDRYIQQERDSWDS